MQAQEGERARDQGDGAEAEVECVLCQEQPPQPQPLPGQAAQEAQRLTRLSLFKSIMHRMMKLVPSKDSTLEG